MSFPIPKWPPIQALDSIDIIGKRRDGGLDLAIVASQPIDSSPETLSAIREKVRTYLSVIDLEDFQGEMGYPPREKTTIVLKCGFPIHPVAEVVIQECRLQAESEGVRLVVERE